MHRKRYAAFFLLVGLSIGLAISDRLALRAQEGNPNVPHAGSPFPTMPAASPSPAGRPSPSSVQDVLLRPYRFSFSRPTSLAQVALHLKQTLGITVVLDVAAMERQDVQAEDTVKLELDGVRLKTGLKLLLDQVRMTYHIVPEDNLLIFTDKQGSDDPMDRIYNEMRTIHRELHDVQDAVDELTDAVYDDQGGEGARLRKPTIIEEKPEAGAPSPEAVPGDSKRKGGIEAPEGAPKRPRSSKHRTSLRHRRRAPGS